MLILLLWATYLGICAVRADTEIRNFKLPLSPSSSQQIPPPITDLENIKSGIQTLNVSDASPDLWLLWTPKSDEEWTSWTARISWPGSSPTKFNLDLYPLPTPDQGGVIIHIASAELSPRFPRYPLLGPASYTEKEQNGGYRYQTTFTLVLEPLIFGVLPSTAIPAIFWILVFALGSGMTVPYLRRRIEDIVNYTSDEDSNNHRLKTL